MIAENVTTDKLEIVIPAGAGGEGDYSLSITPERAGWGYSSFKVLELAAGGTHTFATGEDEWVVLPLSGSCTVDVRRRDLHPRRARAGCSPASATSPTCPATRRPR